MKLPKHLRLRIQDSEEVVVVEELEMLEVGIKQEEAILQCHMEIANPTTKRRQLRLRKGKRLKSKGKSKAREEATTKPRKSMRTRITTDTFMLPDLNTTESLSLQKLNCLASLLKSRGKSNLTRMISTRR